MSCRILIACDTYPENPWYRDRLPAIREAGREFDLGVIDIFEFRSTDEAHQIHARSCESFFVRRGEYISVLELNELFFNRVLSTGCDILILGTVDNYSWYLQPDTIGRLQSEGILVVGILGDDEFTFHRNRLYVPLLDRVVVYVKEFCDRYNSIKNDSAHYLPNSCFFPERDFSRLQVEDEDKTSDVLLMGSPFGGRPELVRALVAADVDVAVYGSAAWKEYSEFRHHYRGYLPAGEFGRVIQDSRIVLASLEDHLTGSPHMNTKIWDAVKYGQFCISTFYPPLLEDYGLEEGENIVMYRSVSDLVELVKFYLSNPGQRAEIARNLFLKVQESFDYTEMYRRLFSELKKDRAKSEERSSAPISPCVTIINLSTEKTGHPGFENVFLDKNTRWRKSLTADFERFVKTPYVILSRGLFSYSEHINDLILHFPEELESGFARLHLASGESLGISKKIVEIDSLVWESQAFLDRYLKSGESWEHLIRDMPYSFGDLRLCTRLEGGWVIRFVSGLTRWKFVLVEIGQTTRKIAREVFEPVAERLWPRLSGRSRADN